MVHRRESKNNNDNRQKLYLREITVLYQKANVIVTILRLLEGKVTVIVGEIASLLSLSDDKSAQLLATHGMTDHVTKVTQDATEMMSSTNEKKVPFTGHYYQWCSPRYFL